MKNEKLAVINSEETTATSVQLSEIENGNFPDLENATVLPFDLMADYWTPENPGESKKVLFDKISTRQVLDQQTSSIIELECAFFLEQTNGQIKSISNGSKRLVGALELMQRMTPILITYLGKKRNRTNSFMSDNWSIKPLRLKLSENA